MKKKLSIISVISMTILSLCSVLAIFCYVIVPDNSPNANLQIPQIALLKPTAKQLLYPENILPPIKTSLLGRIVNGVPNRYKYYPVDSLTYNDGKAILYFGKQIRIVDAGNAVHIEKKLTTKRFWLGTDKYGRDILSRLIVGLRVSLLVGLFAVIISIIIGTFFGMVSGYYGRWIDRVIMTIINVNWSIPTLLLAFAILLVMERGLMAIFLAVGFTLWVDLARIVRGQVLEIKEKEFVLAAKTLGFSPLRIMIKHILPNLTGTVLVIASINFATAILVEAGLSYLGLGVQPPLPSLGNMLKENYGYATSGFLVLSLAPAFAIVILVLSFNLLGNGLRDYFDIRR